jgi:hypothetical protein
VIHLGRHEHHVVKGMCREALEEIKALVEGQVSSTLNTKISIIALNENKAFLAHQLIYSIKMAKYLWKLFRLKNLTM